jgi:pimeloyl-ACP methyl ester carboxylesterase
LPLIVTHGWPGSVIEQLGIIGPLTDPTAHGANAEDAFDIVIPSLPGFGFSEKPKSTGWGTNRIARAWGTLMNRLGYTRYVAQGGDWGAQITDRMGNQAPNGLLGIHVNLLTRVPPHIAQAIFGGQPAPAGLSPEEKVAYEKFSFFLTHGYGYFVEMQQRPQTIGYSQTDSPIGLATWMIDHDADSYGKIASTFNGQPVGGFTQEAILDNITLYWVTNTGASAGRIYWERGAEGLAPFEVKIPAAVTEFPGELYGMPRNWAEWAYPNLIHYSKVNRGGHFAAWEEPELFSEELRVAFRSLR